MSYYDKLPWLWLPSQLLLQLPWPFEVELAAVRLYCNYIDSFILEPIHEVNRIVVKTYTLLKLYSLLTFQHVQPEKEDKRKDLKA